MVESSYLGSMLRVVMFGCFAGLSSCAPGFDDTISLADVKKANEGVVFLNVTYAGRPCRTGNIVLATEPSPGRYVLHSGPMIGGITSAAINPRQITLAAGRYHVGSLQCMVDDKMLAIGPHDGTVVVGNPLQSLASFSISSGEVVNLGQINITPTDYRADNGTICNYSPLAVR